MKLLKKLLKKLLIAVVSLVLLTCLAEVVGRLAEPGPFALFDSNPYLKGKAAKGLRQWHKSDFEGRWDGTWYATNSQGMRGPELPERKAPGEIRVVALGDSCTFGKSVVEEDTWPRQLESMLNEELGDKRSAVVANLGCNGYAGKDYITIFKKLGRQLNPDLVVVGYNLNDFPNVLQKIDAKAMKETSTKDRVRKLVGGRKNLDYLNRFSAYRWARAIYQESVKSKGWEQAEKMAKGTTLDKELKRANNKANDPEAMDALENELITLRDLTNQAGAKLAIFLFPYESQVYLDSYDRTPIERMAEICERIDVPFVSLDKKFREWAFRSDPPERMYVFGDRYHPLPVGYRIVAENVLDIARKMGWLKAG